MAVIIERYMARRERVRSPSTRMSDMEERVISGLLDYNGEGREYSLLSFFLPVPTSFVPPQIYEPAGKFATIRTNLRYSEFLSFSPQFNLGVEYRSTAISLR